MKPRSRAERQQDVAAAAAAGPDADEAMQREWAAQREQRERQRIIEGLKDREDNVRALEAQAQEGGDEALKQQVELQREQIERDRARHNLPNTPVRAASPVGGAVARGAGGIPPPMAFEAPAPAPVPGQPNAAPAAPGGAQGRQGLFGGPGQGGGNPGLFGMPGQPRPHARPNLHAAPAAPAPAPAAPGAAAAASAPPWLAQGCPADSSALGQSPQQQAQPSLFGEAPVAAHVVPNAAMPTMNHVPAHGGGQAVGHRERREEFLRRRQQQFEQQQQQQHQQQQPQHPSPRPDMLQQTRLQPRNVDLNMPQGQLQQQSPSQLDHQPPAQDDFQSPPAGGYAAAPFADTGCAPVQGASLGFEPASGPGAFAQGPGQGHGQGPGHGAPPWHEQGQAPGHGAAPWHGQGQGQGQRQGHGLQLQEHGAAPWNGHGQGHGLQAQEHGSPPWQGQGQGHGHGLGQLAQGQQHGMGAWMGHGQGVPSQACATPWQGGGPMAGQMSPPAASNAPGYHMQCPSLQAAQPCSLQHQPLPTGQPQHVSFEPSMAEAHPVAEQTSTMPPFGGNDRDRAAEAKRAYGEELRRQAEQDKMRRMGRLAAEKPQMYNPNAATPVSARGGQPGAAPDGGLFAGLGDNAAKDRERVRRLHHQDQSGQPVPPGSVAQRGKAMPREEPELNGPPTGFARIGRVSSANDDDKQKKRDDMRRVLAEQVAERERKKKEEEQRRKEEEERDLERMKREQEQEKKRFEEEKEREAKKKKAVQEENERRRAEGQEKNSSSPSSPSVQRRRRRGDGTPEQFQAEVAPAPGRPDLFGLPPGHGDTASSRPPRPDLFAPPAPMHGDGQAANCARPDLFGPPPGVGGAVEPPVITPTPWGAPAPGPPPWENRAVHEQPHGSPPAHARQGNEWFEGVMHQQQELHRQQHEALERLQAEADKLRREKEEAKQSLLELKEKQVEEKEREVRKLQKQVQRQLLLQGHAGLAGFIPGLDDDDDAAGLGIADGIGPLPQPFYSKYEDVSPPAGQSAAQGPAQHVLDDDGRPPTGELHAGPPVHLNPEALGSSSGWSVAPIPWLAHAEAVAAVDYGAEQKDRDVSFEERPFKSPAKPRQMEDSLFEESWGKALTAGSGLGADGDGVVRDDMETHAGVVMPEDASMCKTLVGESKFMNVDGGDTTWRESSFSFTSRERRADLKPLPEDSTAQGAEFSMSGYPPQRLSYESLAATGTSLGRPLDTPAAAGAHAPVGVVAELEAAVRAIREARGEELGTDVAPHSTAHGFDEEVVRAARLSPGAVPPRTEDLLAEAANSTAGSDSQELRRYGREPQGARCASHRRSRERPDGPTTASSFRSERQDQVPLVADTPTAGSWAGILRKFGGGVVEEHLRSANSTSRLAIDGRRNPADQHEAGCRNPDDDLQSSLIVQQDSSLRGPDSPLTGAEPDSIDRLRQQSELNHDGIVRENVSSRGVDLSTPIRSHDFEAIAAAEQEDFESFLSRLRAKDDLADPKPNAGNVRTPSNHRSHSLAGVQGDLRRERVRNGSPVLRSAASSVLRSGSVDSSIGSQQRPWNADSVTPAAAGAASRPTSASSNTSKSGMPSLAELRRQRRPPRTADDIALSGVADGTSVPIAMGAPGISLNATFSTSTRSGGSRPVSALEKLRAERRPASRDRFPPERPP